MRSLIRIGNQLLIRRPRHVRIPVARRFPQSSFVIAVGTGMTAYSFWKGYHCNQSRGPDFRNLPCYRRLMQN